MLTIEKIKEVSSRIGKKYGVKNIYLFGSYAKGKANENSDVDLIIERGDVKTYDSYYDMRMELIDNLGTKVDLLATDGVKPRFFEMIKDERILLYGA